MAKKRMRYIDFEKIKKLRRMKQLCYNYRFYYTKTAFSYYNKLYWDTIHKIINIELNKILK